MKVGYIKLPLYNLWGFAYMKDDANFVHVMSWKDSLENINLF